MRNGSSSNFYKEENESIPLPCISLCTEQNAAEYASAAQFAHTSTYPSKNVKTRSLASHRERVGEKKKKCQSAKRYKVTQPSKYFHVCVRTGDQVWLAPCANVESGRCCKAVCEKRFQKHRLSNEWHSDRQKNRIVSEMSKQHTDRLPEGVWTVCHCRGECPLSAECKIYARTSKRRHTILKQKEVEKERAAAAKRSVSFKGNTQIRHRCSTMSRLPL